MYLGLSILIAVLTIFVPVLIGSFLSRGRRGALLTGAILGTIACAGLLWFVQWIAAVGIYGPTPLFGQIIVGCVISTIILAVGETWWAALPGAAGALYLLYAIFIPGLGASDAFHNKDKAALFQVEEVSAFHEMLPPIETSAICLVDEAMARNAANSALSQLKLEGGVVAGSRYTLDDRATKCWVDGAWWWIFQLDFQGWLKWRQFKEVPAYIRVSAQDPFANAEIVTANTQGEAFHIRYLLTACFEYRADRYLREHGYMNAVLEDWTFEPDDSWNPHYTVSVLKRNYGFSGCTPIGILVLDVQSGAIHMEQHETLDPWIDRQMPLNVINYSASRWGQYHYEGWWYNVWHNDKSKEPTAGWFLTFHPKLGCMFYTGWTSANSKTHDLIGFSLTSSRTGKSLYFATQGVTETKAAETAASLWSDFRYLPSAEVPLYNLYGHATYVIPMEAASQFKGVSLVSAINYNINAKGDNLEQAVANYRAALAKAHGTGIAPNIETVQKRVIKNGVIDLAGQPLIQGGQQIFVFTVRGVPKIFQVVYTYANPKVPFLASGMKVDLSFADTQERVITCDTFDLPEIVVNDENPSQATFESNQGKVAAESGRMSNELEQQRLLRSDELKKVDPKALEEFLRQQGQKK